MTERPGINDPIIDIELRYHSAIPEWCKFVGLKIKVIPECEGGGFMVERHQAEKIMKLILSDRMK